MRAIVLAGVFAAAGVAGAAPGKLDGKTFGVQVKGPDGKPFDDHLLFMGGTLESVACQEFGFTAAPYQAKPKSAAWTFSATARSAKQGTGAWSGTVDGERVEGKMVWRRPGKKPETYTFSGAALKPLYDRLGGEAAIKAVVADFIDALVVDAVLNANPAIDEARKRVPAEYLKTKVSELVCMATGGPQKYTGRSMKESHARLDIGEKEWAEMARVFVGVLDKFKVPRPEQGELLSIIGSTKGDIVTRR